MLSHYYNFLTCITRTINTANHIIAYTKAIKCYAIATQK